MYIVARISILLVSNCVVVTGGEPTPRSFKVDESLPSRLYLPTSPNPEPKNRARTSDIEAVLENDLQVIPLAVDHDQRNGFQYQPIIWHQYSRGSTESRRYSQSAVENLTQSGNTRRPGSPISNANEVKPITKSQLSREAVAYSFRANGNGQSEESRGPFPSSLRRFQSLESPGDQTPGYLPRWKVLTVNDQENNTEGERLPPILQLTTPREESISRISRHRIDKVYSPASSTKLVPASGPWSKENVLIDHPAARDIKPIFESYDYATNYNDYNNRAGCKGGNYQLGTRNTAAFPAGYFNGPFKRPASSNILGRSPLQAYRGYNHGCNTQEHLSINPILDLLLSHHGIYLPRGREPRAYGYMAVNNIHNNKPFGSYKLTRDDDAIFVP